MSVHGAWRGGRHGDAGTGAHVLRRVVPGVVGVCKCVRACVRAFTADSTLLSLTHSYPHLSAPLHSTSRLLITFPGLDISYLLMFAQAFTKQNHTVYI